MSVKIATPSILDKFELGDSVFFKGSADNNITTIKLFAEQYLLSTIAVTNGMWSAAYPFNRAGKRRIVARGYNSSDQDLGQDSIDIVVNSNDIDILGIDVSNYDPNVKWLDVAATNSATFAFAKASEGKNFRDQSFANHWSGMRSAGIIRGAYHFFLPDVSVDDQVDNFISMLGQLSPGDLPPALDLEPFPDSVKARWESVSLSDRISRTREWLEKVENKLGKKPIIYTLASFWEEFMDDTEDFVDYPLWVANFVPISSINTRKPAVPANNWGGNGYAIWQFTDTGTVRGVSGYVDRNIFNGNLSKLLELTNS
jgi:lysozyme